MVIHWKDVINDLEKKFGRRHSDNKVKNYWYAMQRSQLVKARAEKQEQIINDFVHSFP